MTYTKLFGLESFPVKDYELMSMLEEAKKKHMNTLEFKTKLGKVVKIKTTDLYPEGIMQGHYRMYKGD